MHQLKFNEIMAMSIEIEKAQIIMQNYSNLYQWVLIISTIQIYNARTLENKNIFIIGSNRQ